jgi:hypothetical protein
MFEFLSQQCRAVCVVSALATALLASGYAHASNASAPASAAGASTPRTVTALTFKGEFQGSGRACAGHLKIAPKRLSWKTSFSTCSSRTFQASELEPLQGRKRFLYQFTSADKNCRFRTIVLSHPDPTLPVAAAAWDVTGYRSASDYAAASVEHSMSCAVIQTG